MYQKLGGHTGFIEGFLNRLSSSEFSQGGASAYKSE